MAKRKKATVAQEVEKAAKLLQRYVRLKASDDNGYCQCVTCGKVDHYKAMQGGHFYSRRHTVFKLFEENIHPQCPACNVYGMKTTRTQEALWEFYYSAHLTSYKLIFTLESSP
jgi:hypothetical protein